MRSRHRAIPAATKAEAEYQDRARRLGCVVCRFRGCKQPNATTLHHRNGGDHHGQKQIGQGAVVSLCAWHHDGWQLEGMTVDQMTAAYGPSFKYAGPFRRWTAEVIGGRGTEAWQQYQDQLLQGKQAA